MPRENSFTDSEGRSLTPDFEDELQDHPALEGARPISPIYPPQSLISPEPLSQPTHNVSAHHIASALSLRSRLTGKSAARTPWPGHGTPKERFRMVARKVMAMRRGTSLLSGVGKIGAEPGVNPRRASADALYSHISQDCVIEVVDYSAVGSSFGRMTNKEFVNLMGDPQASQREKWVKVRWINIGGMSWDVIKAVSIKYDLHPLALEDVFSPRSQNRSKADYYSKHLFLRILCHELGVPDGEIDPLHTPAYGSTLIGGPRSTSPLPIEDEDGKVEQSGADDEPTLYGSSPNSTTAKKRGRRPLLPSSMGDLEAMLGDSGSPSRLSKLLRAERAAAEAHEAHKEEEVSLEALKKGERVNVKVSPMFIFLFRDGTVISIRPTPNVDFTAPITRRLRQLDTGLRKSADPSLLVHALLDLIVDNALEVIDEYHRKISKFERAILLKPQMKTVRHLHILSGDLILHKRTLEPIRTLIYGLRRYDVDRCAALIDTSKEKNIDVKVVGFMSHKSKIYLADVFDHMEYILTSLDMFAGIAENLINYTFNLASYEMNEVMRRLTLATIIFLPLTLLTGYFGMNFGEMWSVQNNSDLFFWEIAIPIMVVIIPAFILPDIQRMFHYVQKQLASKKAVKTYKRA